MNNLIELELSTKTLINYFKFFFLFLLFVYFDKDKKIVSNSIKETFLLWILIGLSQLARSYFILNHGAGFYKPTIPFPTYFNDSLIQVNVS